MGCPLFFFFSFADRTAASGPGLALGPAASRLPIWAGTVWAPGTGEARANARGPEHLARLRLPWPGQMHRQVPAWPWPPMICNQCLFTCEPAMITCVHLLAPQETSFMRVWCSAANYLALGCLPMYCVASLGGTVRFVVSGLPGLGAPGEWGWHGSRASAVAVSSIWEQPGAPYLVRRGSHPSTPAWASGLSVPCCPLLPLHLVLESSMDSILRRLIVHTPQYASHQRLTPSIPPAGRASNSRAETCVQESCPGGASAATRGLPVPAWATCQRNFGAPAPIIPRSTRSAG